MKKFFSLLWTALFGSPEDPKHSKASAKDEASTPEHTESPTPETKNEKPFWQVQQETRLKWAKENATFTAEEGLLLCGELRKEGFTPKEIIWLKDEKLETFLEKMQVLCAPYAEERLVQVVFHGPKDPYNWKDEWECEVFFYNVPEPPKKTAPSSNREYYYDYSRRQRDPMPLSEAAKDVASSFEDEALFWKKLALRLHVHWPTEGEA